MYVWLSGNVWGLTVVNCDCVDQISGLLRILCSMRGVLVVVNGATYFEGYRMDGREGFADFVKKYEYGRFDEDPLTELQLTTDEEVMNKGGQV
ncbi:hypothetical protein BCR34DRAFT_567072 [Clohesyomyces aquaticus]|uniref:Uncharacterized protein n=1 Tax=Clohesyomyces aquaticus TaxID=1231657 RepID=A0A1Y1ZK21_9PLEO|nr:hypothetical protein BCR34DRAFT_567072 [Clohesyomyces aquaticus]